MAPTTPGYYGGLSLHLSSAEYLLRCSSSVARARRGSRGNPSGPDLAPSAAKRELVHSRRMDADRHRSDPRPDTDQDRHSAYRMEMALPAHRDLARRRRLTVGRVAGKARLARFQLWFSRDARDNLSGGTRSRGLQRALHPRKLADAQSHSESGDASRHNERRRRRPRGPVLPQFRASLRPAENSQQVLHGIGVLRALPRRHL